ncbi:MAG: carbonic anhydrase [Clostridium sp.]|nr:carbonic anhydrase [Clostridium sp.]
MDKLIKVRNKSDITENYKNTPIGKLLEYHNLNKASEKVENAELLIGTCMDNRIKINVPQNFAYVIRTGGGNLHNSDFYVSYALSSGVKAIAIIVHNDCGMVNLASRKEKILSGIVEATGWRMDQAENYFNSFAPMCEIVNEIDFARIEVDRLRKLYPNVLVAPLFYNVTDDLLYIIQE